MTEFQEDEWNYPDNFLEHDKSFSEFECNLREIRDDIIRLDCFKIKSGNGNFVKSDEKKNVEDIMERNKELRLEIEAKLGELNRKKIQYEDFKKDKKLLTEEIKNRHEAYLMAKKYYKKFLKIYYTMESKTGEMQTIYLQFFTDTKKSSDTYSIRLRRNVKSGQYTLIEMNPKLEFHQELEKRLQETNDVPNTICCIRNAFMKIRKNNQE